ncbi:HAMP domain-containing protein [Desulfopila sp. IMCC35006]|uniref:methyl-accepting chemotaxis protein n=1 Tax=Desulfopila sp. IMCC35006 TaxID=2569542 RepID=UPI0010ABA16D|nr:Cache 3/Cache 2 fusion domain-containing protein [Desulfopila sp. IMCC35006]TKB25502.1 HAMP domain-containing protein [Desulfopila sp. IMCC35006]
MFKKIRNMQFTTKLFIAVVCITMTSILITSGNAIRMADSGLYSLGEGAIKDIHQSAYNSLRMYDKNMRLKLDGDLLLLEQQLKAKGAIFLDEGKTRQETLVNQVTKESTTKEIPQLQAGVSYINGYYDIVDNIETISGSSATIFQLVDDKLLRISTTVKKQDGQRAVGTYIPSDSAVYKSIMRGETYRGKAFVVNDWYLTAYAPLRDMDNNIIGAIYVGQLMLSPQVKDFITETTIGAGYFFVYADAGEILIHPSLDSTTNIYELIPEFKGVNEGFIRYNWKGTEKVTYIRHLKEWGIFIAVGLNRGDILNGLDAKMLRNNLLVGLLVVSAGILVAIFLVRSINRPLKELADKSFKVGNGDYTIDFASENKDAIGQLTNSLGSMVEKSRDMLRDISQSSQDLAAAATQLAAISELMVTNADATTTIADTTATNAGEVSDNMNSVSAAMEESTVNLDMIASASEEMGNTIKEIAENSSRARLTTEEAVVSAQKSHERVQELGEAARSIGTVTETITEISEQTNLLALNATIEAARAGEAGKGFAVVANEIKELAKQTAAATGKIKSAIDKIQQQTGATVTDIEAITRVISDVNEIVSTIVTAVEEQSITTNEIVNNVAQASSGITEINHNVASSSQMTTMMLEGVGQVKEQSLEVKENSQQVRTSADGLSELSGKLTQLVAKFKI